jgi:pimeloyl-ACP methyl ester carboxylesterase
VRTFDRLFANLALAGCLVTTGCAISGQEHAALVAPERLDPSVGLVLVADGAGDFRATSQALRDEIKAEKLPLRVETFVWSHGYLRIFADQLDQRHARRQGHDLAEAIARVRHISPQQRIIVVAHSAGCAVVLEAAANLPANTVDRMLLLAPSVPTDFDLRPALRCVREEIDVFSSNRDCGYLRASDFFTSLARGRFCTAAGSTGFQPILQAPEDVALYQKLRGFPWEPRLIWTGHDGGHFGYYQQGYLRNFVLPLLTDQKSEARQ